MNLKFKLGGLFALLLGISTITLKAQDNLAGSAVVAADTSHMGHPAVAAIDGDTVDGGGWGVLAMDTVDQSGINVAPGATATADESSENGPPSGAIDGDTADWAGWSVTSTSEHAPHWMELTWESAQSVNKVVLYTTSAADGAYALRGYRIQYWDGADYQDLDTISGNREARITSTFPSAVTTKIRIYCEEPDSASLWYRISELEVYTDVIIEPHWLELTWAAPKIMNKVVLFTNSAENGAYALRSYDIQYWDGTAWQTTAEVSGNADSKVSSTFPTVNTSKIRIYCKEPDSASRWYRINELEVYYDAPKPVEITPHWLELSWESALTINRIILFTNSAKAGAFALRAYDIQYWGESAWQSLAAVIDNTEAEVSSTFEAVSTSKIRIFCKEPDIASKWYRINEVEVYNDSQTAVEELAESKKDALFVYMDPHTRETVIAAPDKIDQIQVYSMSGILVHADPVTTGTKLYRLPSGTLPPGAYVVVVNRLNSKQFIIK
jgi:hypothetical protein